MAVVWFVLTDDYQVKILFQLGEGVDVRFVQVGGLLEAGMEYRAMAGEPWVDKNIVCAGKAIGFVCRRICWREA